MGLFDFLKKIVNSPKKEKAVPDKVSSDKSEKENPFLEGALYASDDNIIDKLNEAGYMWESLEHNEEDFDFLLTMYELDSLQNYYLWNRKNNDVFDEEELVEIIRNWALYEC